MQNPKDLPIHEFIDLNVCIRQSPDPGVQGINGKIIDETMNTFWIEKVDGSRIIVQKSKNLFEFICEDNMKVMVRGEDISLRPQDRIKKLFHRRKQLVK